MLLLPGCDVSTRPKPRVLSYSSKFAPSNPRFLLVLPIMLDLLVAPQLLQESFLRDWVRTSGVGRYGKHDVYRTSLGVMPVGKPLTQLVPGFHTVKCIKGLAFLVSCHGVGLVREKF